MRNYTLDENRHVEDRMTELIVTIGCAAGFARDRTDSAEALIETLAEAPGPRFLVFETLAERTLAQAQVAKREDPTAGYSPAFEALLRPVIGSCKTHGIRIIGNFGAANPAAAARLAKQWATEAGYPDLKVAYVTGDDLVGRISIETLRSSEIQGTLLHDTREVTAVNAYLGAEPVAAALDEGADIVITGRIADPVLALAPLIHSFGWASEDWDSLACGVLAGHLLECGAQVTGGYYADPGVKDVPELDRVGYPIAEVSMTGEIIISKAGGTGGRVDLKTVTEQILYEIHDPAAYMTPDVTLDMTAIELEQVAPDRVRVSGARGHPRPETLKATVCIEGGYLAEAEISYAGPNAEARARLAADIVRKRMLRQAPGLMLHVDIIGLVSVFAGSAFSLLDMPQSPGVESLDLRLRVAAVTEDRSWGERLLNEVEALYCAGPAGGGGVRTHLTRRFKSASCLVPRHVIQTAYHFCEEVA